MAERNWLNEGLAGSDPAFAAKVRDDDKFLSYLDKALVGVSDDVKVDVLRVMVNTGIPPDDVTNLLLALYGHIRAAGEIIPREIRDASAKFSDLLAQFNDETQLFPEIVVQVIEKVAERITAEAEAIGKNHTRAASIAEVEKHKLRLASVTEDAMRQFLENAVKQQQRFATDGIIIRGRVITVIAAGVVMFMGFLGGSGWGTTHAIMSREQKTDMVYGRQFVQMYQDMSADQKSWVAAWSMRHTVK